MFKKIIFAATLGVLVLGFVAQGLAQGNPNPEVLPLNSHAFGTTYPDLALRWTQWGLEIPAAVNPILDETGEHAAEGQSGKVWFLAGNFGGATTRVINVPHGKALFFPIICYQGWAPTDGETEEEVRQTANWYEDQVTVLECAIDGRDLQDLFSYREESPAGILGPNDMTDVPEGSEILLADGYWLLLAPLANGQHVIHFYGVLGPPEDPWFWLDVTYYITVGGE